jgi:TfoX/Sxy family transcriptional regulator of competence genes
MPMKWIPTPQPLVETFAAIVPSDRRVEPRKMFGYPSCFAGGNMFMGLFQDRMIVRLAPEGRARLMARGGSVFEPMPGRPMKEYVVVPEPILSDPPSLKRLVEESLDYALTLPPKAKAPKPQAKGPKAAKAKKAPAAKAKKAPAAKAKKAPAAKGKKAPPAKGKKAPRAKGSGTAKPNKGR